MRLKDKYVIITGASTGIGCAVAELFAKEGARVLVADVNKEDGEKTVEGIIKSGGDASFVYTDVSDEKSVQEMVKKGKGLYGVPDILVNNAGIEIVKPVLNTSVEEWDRLMGINLRGYFLCVKHVVPEMQERGGVIINTASIAGILGTPLASLYSSSKGAIVLFTKSLSGELKQLNIRVNCVCPALIRTPLGDNFIQSFEDQGIPILDMVAQRQGPPGTPEDVAPAFLFLATDDSKLMNGHTLILDGGMSAV